MNPVDQLTNSMQRMNIAPQNDADNKRDPQQYIGGLCCKK